MRPTRNERLLAAELMARRSGCPRAEQLQDYAEGRLEGSERGRIGAHLARCPSCETALRFLDEERTIGEADAEEPPLEVVRRSDQLIDVLRREARPRVWAWGLGLASAAAALTVALLLPRGGEAPGPPVLRGGEQPVLTSLVPEDRPLPREAFLLRWVGGPEGSRYDLTVLDERLEIVLVAEGLDRAECRVPPETLRAVPAGARLHWQVEAVLPDGSRRTSLSFVAKVE